MKLVKNIKKEEFYSYYYRTLSSVLGISKMEVKVLAEMSSFMSKGIDPTSKESRKLICNNLDISSYSLANYISAFKERGILIPNQTDGKKIHSLKLNPAIYIANNKKEYEIIFKYNII